jgi:hypothetical protein
MPKALITQVNAKQLEGIVELHERRYLQTATPNAFEAVVRTNEVEDSHRGA